MTGNTRPKKKKLKKKKINSQSHQKTNQNLLKEKNQKKNSDKKKNTKQHSMKCLKKQIRNQKKKKICSKGVLLFKILYFDWSYDVRKPNQKPIIIKKNKKKNTPTPKPIKTNRPTSYDLSKYKILKGKHPILKIYQNPRQCSSQNTKIQRPTSVKQSNLRIHPPKEENPSIPWSSDIPPQFSKVSMC